MGTRLNLSRPRFAHRPGLWSCLRRRLLRALRPVVRTARLYWLRVWPWCSTSFKAPLATCLHRWLPACRRLRPLLLGCLAGLRVIADALALCLFRGHSLGALLCGQLLLLLLLLLTLLLLQLSHLLPRRTIAASCFS